MRIFDYLLVGLLCLGWAGSSNDTKAEFPQANRPEIFVKRLDKGTEVAHEGVVDFPGTWMGRDVTICFDIGNRGKKMYKIEEIAVRLGSSFKKASCPGLTRRMDVPEWQHTCFCVRFRPRRRKICEGVVVILSNDPLRNPYVLHLRGKAWKTEYSVHENDLHREIMCGKTRCHSGMACHFGRVRVGSKSSRTFFISNRFGDPWIQPTATITGLNADDFTLPGLAIDRITRLQDGKAPRLQGDERYKQVIVFSPKASGIRCAVVRIAGVTREDNAEPCEFVICGEAVKPEPAVH